MPKSHQRRQNLIQSTHSVLPMGDSFDPRDPLISYNEYVLGQYLDSMSNWKTNSTVIFYSTNYSDLSVLCSF